MSCTNFPATPSFYSFFFAISSIFLHYFPFFTSSFSLPKIYYDKLELTLTSDQKPQSYAADILSHTFQRKSSACLQIVYHVNAENDTEAVRVSMQLCVCHALDRRHTHSAVACLPLVPRGQALHETYRCSRITSFATAGLRLQHAGCLGTCPQALLRRNGIPVP